MNSLPRSPWKDRLRRPTFGRLTLANVIALAAFCLWAGAVSAQVPATNDMCGSAEVIRSDLPFPLMTSLIDITNATTTGDPPAPECQPFGLSRSVWYRFTPTTTAFYTFSVASNETRTTVEDTVMAIYTSDSGCGGLFTLRACNDDIGEDRRSAIGTTLNAGVTYYVVVWAFFFDPSTSGTLVEMRVNKPSPPANDTCDKAVVISPSDGFPQVTALTDIILAETNNDPPFPAACLTSFSEGASRTVWYRFTPTARGAYYFSTCADKTATTMFDTVMGIYTSAGGCSGPFISLACNDNVCSYRSAITANLEPNTTYYILVGEYGTGAPMPPETKVQLFVDSLGDPRPTIIAWQHSEGGFFQLWFQGVSGLRYSALASSDLSRWDPAPGNVYDLGNDLFMLIDMSAGANPHRFYRIRFP